MSWYSRVLRIGWFLNWKNFITDLFMESTNFALWKAKLLVLKRLYYSHRRMNWPENLCLSLNQGHLYKFYPSFQHMSRFGKFRYSGALFASSKVNKYQAKNYYFIILFVIKKNYCFVLFLLIFYQSKSRWRIQKIHSLKYLKFYFG